LRTLLVCAAIALNAFAAPEVLAEPMVGLLGDNLLITFDSANPGGASGPVSVTGLRQGDRLEGIDLRPSTGVLYGIASGGALYTLDASTGRATFVGSLSVQFLNPFIGMDFDPVADLAGAASLRVVTSTPLNLRVNVNEGSIGFAFVDPPIANAFLDGLAYSNNDRDPATGTSLFGIANDALYRVDPIAGTSEAIGHLGTGAPGTITVGFDISGSSGAAFASISDRPGFPGGLYGIDLATGAATLIADFHIQIAPILDITAVGVVAEPPISTLLLLGMLVVGWVSRQGSGLRARGTGTIAFVVRTAPPESALRRA
jgi:hypothetical protein